MQNWQQAEKKKLNELIRKCTRTLMGLPANASTAKLEQMGMHNTLEEIIEAQQTAQYNRLSATEAGRAILNRLNLNPGPSKGREIPLSTRLKTAIHTLPFPRNVHPEHNVARREARATALASKARERPHNCSFVDATQYGDSKHFTAIATDPDGNVLHALTTRHPTTPEGAEQMAIALALLQSSRPTIYSDSCSAIRAFACGRVQKDVAALLEGHEITPHHLIWFPAHMGTHLQGIPNPNELTHRQARDLTTRLATGLRSEGSSFRDPLMTFHEVSSHYKQGRRHFPPPHKSLNRGQASTWRQLQAHAYPCPNTAVKWLQPEINPNCAFCSTPNTLAHMLWQCPPRGHRTLVTEEDWKKALLSTDPQVQLRTVQEAHDVGTSLGLIVPSWARPAS